MEENNEVIIDNPSIIEKLGKNVAKGLVAGAAICVGIAAFIAVKFVVPALRNIEEDDEPEENDSEDAPEEGGLDVED